MRKDITSALLVPFICMGSAAIAEGSGCSKMSDGFARYKVSDKAMHLFECGGQSGDDGNVSIPLGEGQVSISQPALSKDRKKVGWLIEYQDEANPSASPYPGTLVIYNNDDTKIEITVADAIWGWKFLSDGKRVAITHGPLHFSNPVEEIYLLDSVSRKEVKQ